MLQRCAVHLKIHHYNGYWASPPLTAPFTASALLAWSSPQTKLQGERVSMDHGVQGVYASSATPVMSLWDLYQAVWRPFGKLLTDLETTGMLVDRCGMCFCLFVVCLCCLSVLFACVVCLRRLFVCYLAERQILYTNNDAAFPIDDCHRCLLLLLLACICCSIPH